MAIGQPGTTESFPVSGESDWFGLGKIARGSEGSMWFTKFDGVEEEESTVGRMAPTGLITGEFKIPTEKAPTPEDASRLAGLALGADGDMWFTAHGIYNSDEAFIGQITPAGKITEFKMSKGNYREGNFPEDIALGSDGNMWFTDQESETAYPGLVPSSIGRITPVGVISKFAVPGNEILGGIASGSDGNMWFTSTEEYVNSLPTGRSYIGRIAPSGTMTEFAVAIHGGLLGGIALGADGNMWFTEPGVSRVGRITPKGAISEFAAPSVSRSIALGPDGNMWFTEGYTENAIGRIAATGVVTSFASISAQGGSFRSIAAGPEDDLWLTEWGSSKEGGAYLSHVERFIVPFAPVNAGLPVVSGEAVEGRMLSVSGGSWLYNPSTIGYQWQVCDTSGGNCLNLGGEVGTTHVLTVGDVGHTLRAVVNASNVGGSMSAVSAVSAVVGAPAPPAAQATVIREPLPVVGSTMTWSFRPSRTYTIVESLVVHGLPVGGSVEVACDGRGCAFARHRWATAARDHRCHGRRCVLKRQAVLRGSEDLADLFKGRHMGVGARISVTITKTGWVGKSFMFRVRANSPPRVQFACLEPGSNKATGGC
jgi:streptogramin lyase